MGLPWFLILSLSVAFSFFEPLLASSAPLDALSLLRFKDSVTADPFNILASWKLDQSSSDHHCRWYGVTCHPLSRRVISLNLTADSSATLTGTLSASVANLTQLRVLSIPHHNFSGEIPTPISKLPFLEVLELQANNFSGYIPTHIARLRSLRHLNLSSNLFSGPIPARLIGSGRLAVIDLSNNQLSGRVEVGGSCEFLEHLKLSNNFLTEPIPTEISKCWNLRTLLLDGNILEGRIPAQMGKLSELRVLDVSRNSLTERIPKELANCSKLCVLVLTNLVDEDSTLDSARGEFNAFVGAIPYELILLPSLEILWAPRANLAGRLPSTWTHSCSLRVVNLGQNYITGVLPEGIKMCKNMSFLDLSSNNLKGHLPLRLPIPCMLYFNISRNQISGFLPTFGNLSSSDASIVSSNLDNQDILNAYVGLGLDKNVWIIHDFSWNRFVGPLPLFFVGDELLATTNHNFSYRLLLSNNRFNGSLPLGMIPQCNSFKSFSINLNANQLSGEISHALPVDCLRLTDFEAAYNLLEGSFSGSAISHLVRLQRLDLRGNALSGPLPHELGNVKSLKWVLLGGNNMTGEIPSQLGHLTSLVVLDLSQNALTGSIPASLTKASGLETVLLDHNRLSGKIPSSFSTLVHLTQLDVSFNNLSGHIPLLQRISGCDAFKGNRYLQSCPDPYSASPANLPVPLEVHKWHSHKRIKTLIIAAVTCASVVVCVLAVMVLFLLFGRKKLSRLSSLQRKVVVTFADSPSELNYDNVVRATGNFSIQNLIGTGGFGSTYKAELVPGFLVAVKRLSIGRFQGVQQFEAEIRTLGRIRHKNLVTLIGYYVGEAEMLLIYNYLSGGNLESFIHERSTTKVNWGVIHKIAIDIAQALAYLHYSCVPRIVHRDIKPSNILLDHDLNGYLSDFGLARLLEVSETHATTDVAGTFGYVAPEYATTCRVSDKADVYSFGVVLLELMSGKKSLDPSFSDYGNGFNIVAWAKLLIKEGRCSELFCPQLWEAETEPEEKEKLLELLRLASICTVESLSVRPSMKQVLDKLKQLRT
ncbi:LRR receptor-like serine/threonine-protein kinase RPK2 [Humulus lupulus]|uniref:LRR receptor-like serine/threonine-protein kinase RPK2 n=1 Tax=Humulus lupulus TaxID=3486 RepID=UPI002B40ED58|nr:LRR receptor-like serine/threonine-protein kinase RPK2 [Humulus lupulus]XP_062105314.1 LRR receptor-like serine/threonine-protein kinase RPK2 [Humulus lupulus]